MTSISNEVEELGVQGESRVKSSRGEVATKVGEVLVDPCYERRLSVARKQCKLNKANILVGWLLSFFLFFYQFMHRFAHPVTRISVSLDEVVIGTRKKKRLTRLSFPNP